MSSPNIIVRIPPSLFVCVLLKAIYLLCIKLLLQLQNRA
jgi:hypothetical protein